MKVPGLDGEFGFITKVMREDDFNVGYDMLDGAIRRIRVDNVEDK